VKIISRKDYETLIAFEGGAAFYFVFILVIYSDCSFHSNLPSLSIFNKRPVAELVK
jgi:hypothetical protein